MVVDAEPVLVGAVSEAGASSERLDEHPVADVLASCQLVHVDVEFRECRDQEEHGLTGRVDLVRSEFVEDGRVGLPPEAFQPRLEAHLAERVGKDSDPVPLPLLIVGDPRLSDRARGVLTPSDAVEHQRVVLVGRRAEPHDASASCKRLSRSEIVENISSAVSK